MYIYIYIFTYIFICIGVCVCVCMCVCVCVLAIMGADRRFGRSSLCEYSTPYHNSFLIRERLYPLSKPQLNPCKYV